MAGLYIHIPFCASRCIYCSFYSTTSLQLSNQYVDTLCKEIDLRRKEVDTIQTIYLGGGTPSLLSPAHLQQLFQKIKRDRKSTRLNSSHANISYAVFCLKKKTALFVA